MAELGSLSVSLSMDSSQFNGSISQVDRNLRAMGSELKAVRARGTEYGNSLEGLGKRQDVLRRSVEAAGIKLRESRRVYDELVKSGKASDAQLERQARRVNEAQSQFNRLESELKQVDAALKRQSSTWQQMGQRLTDAGSKAKTVGDGMKNMGRDLSMRVTAPIVGMGTAVLKAGMDFEESMSRVQAVSGATGGELTKLEDLAKELGATTKFSASEAASGMEFLAMAGFETNDILSAMPGMLDLAAAGALDLGRAADITSNIMSAFGIEASQAGHISDVLAKAASSANTNVEQLGNAMKPLAPVANTMGWSMEEATAAVMALSDAGIQGEQAGTAFATSLGRLAKPTGEMKKEIDKLGISFFDAQGNMKSMPDVIAEVENATEGMTAQQKSATLTTLFGAEAYKQWAILLDRGSDALETTTKGLVESDGAAAKMAKTMSDNAKGGIKELLSSLEGLAIQLSEILIPHVNRFVAKLTEWSRKFGELSPEAQKTALAVAGVAAAIGPALLAVGSLTSGIGGIIKVAGMASTAIAGAGGLSAVLAALTGPIGLTVAAIAALTAGGIALYNHLKKDSIPEIDRFGDSVSESTKKAVGGFMDLNDEATLALNQLNWSVGEVTTEMAEVITGNFEQMGAQIVVGLGEKRDEAVAVMQDLFAQSVNISEEEQIALLESINNGYDERIAKTEEGNARIAEIMQIASEEKRALTQSEQQEINQIQQTMVDEGIRVLTENEQEQKVILERMERQSGEITARQAAEVVKNSKEQKEKVVAEAEEQYSKAIAEIQYLRDEAGVISAEQADKLIGEAERQKNETVKRAEEMHQSVVKEAKNQAQEHVNQVDWETGEVLSKWRVFADNLMKRQNEMVADAKRKWNEKYTEIKNKAEQIKNEASRKFDELKSNARQKFEETKQNMMRPINEARDKIGEAIEKVKSFFTNLRLKFPKIEMPKLPRFSLTGSFSLNPPSVPKIGVDWYAKGALFTKPTIFNTPYGLKGFGDAGPEAALPLNDRVLGKIGDAISRNMERENQPIVVHLNYHGNDSQDAYTMMDIIEEELNDRYQNRLIVSGVRK